MAKKPDRFCPPHIKAERERREKEREAEKAKRDADYDRNRRYQDPDLARAARIRNSKAWKRLRDWHIRRNPLCADPLGRHGGNPVPAEHVHHIQSIVEAPNLAFEASNLCSLCHSCHNAVEAMSRGGSPLKRFHPNLPGWVESN